MTDELDPREVGSNAGLGATVRPLPRGEVMATGRVGDLIVELVRYTEHDIRQRDKDWLNDVERERSIATKLRCRMLNLEMDLRAMY